MHFYILLWPTKTQHNTTFNHTILEMSMSVSIFLHTNIHKMPENNTVQFSWKRKANSRTYEYLSNSVHVVRCRVDQRTSHKAMLKECRTQGINVCVSQKQTCCNKIHRILCRINCVTWLNVWISNVGFRDCRDGCGSALMYIPVVCNII